MLGTFLPWNAKTLEACPLRFEASPEGIERWRFSCCRSFVVVIFVNSPATISMISVIGIPLISYFSVGSPDVCRSSCLLNEENSSLAKF
jgi:hypothetical protein